MWEWYHIRGVWIINGFSGECPDGVCKCCARAQPRVGVIGIVVGVVACAGSGYIGAKVSEAAEMMRADTPNWTIEFGAGLLSSSWYSIKYPVITIASFHICLHSQSICSFRH